MRNNLTYSDVGLKLTELSESLELVSYQDQGGVWTNGYGHTGPDVFPAQHITTDQAVEWLKQDVQTASNAVNNLVTVQLDQNQFDALVDFVFNIGVKNFESSTLLRMLNNGDYENAAVQFDRWDKVKGNVIAGLLKRRENETKLFEET